MDEWLKSANSLSPNDIEAGNNWFYSFHSNYNYSCYIKDAFNNLSYSRIRTGKNLRQISSTTNF